MTALYKYLVTAMAPKPMASTDLSYQCAACGQVFAATFKLTWDAHCCAACGDYIANALGETRANPGMPMGLKDGSMRYVAAGSLRRAGFKPTPREPEAMRIVFCNDCGCHYSQDCPTHREHRYGKSTATATR